MADRSSESLSERFRTVLEVDNGRDILPASLLDLHSDTLRKRMGGANFERRIRLEKKLNPATPSNAFRWSRRTFSWIVESSGTFGLTLAGRRKSARQSCWDFQIEKNRLTLPRINREVPHVRILHLSDFHLDTRIEQAERWAKEIQALAYDIAVITGDFFNAFKLPDSRLRQALHTVISAIHAPVYAVLGNHDCLLLTPYLESEGIRVLLNESEWLKIDGRHLLITGLDDSHFFRSSDFEQALSSESCTPHSADLALLLSHCPTPAKEAAKRGFHLFLTGHTHGGQICFRSGKPLLRNGGYPSGLNAGNWTIGNMAGYTSRGTGTGKLCYRINCPPEIVVHEIGG